MSRQRNIETIESSELVTIGELVRLTGMRYSTLKHYTEERMLPFGQAEENLTRRYNREETIERITLIKKLKSEGMTILEIKHYMGVSDFSFSSCSEDNLKARTQDKQKNKEVNASQEARALSKT